MKAEPKPSEQLAAFLDFLDQCMSRYDTAHSNMEREDKRLQDLLHAIELAPDKAERNRAATRLQQSRKKRREGKDTVILYEEIVRFLGDERNHKTLERMRQLMGWQRKEEEYLSNERTYKPRVER